MKITWREFFKFIFPLLCLAIAAFIYLMYILFLRIKTATDTILFMPIIIKSAVVTCVVAGTAAVLFVFGAICVVVYELMTSPKVTNEQKVTLDDVAVSDDVRRELRKICKLQLKREIEIDEKLNYAQDTGYIFYGPPGTGKTLLAKAIANETKSSFISVSASDFIQRYVGTGPGNIRKLFEKARKNAPCIVFIDEIDSVGEKRCDGSSYGHQAYTETLNQLLTELDGFKSREGVIVIAATNRMGVLDSALTRSGRLSKHINIPLPDENLREKILNLYMKDTPRTEDLDLTELAGRTKGFSGADLFNLVNSVKDFARNRIVKEDTEEIVITMNDVSNALEKLKDEFQKPENEEANVGNVLQTLFSIAPRNSNGLTST